MRIIHEIATSMQCSAGTYPYRHMRGFQGYGGMRVDVLITTNPHTNCPDEFRLGDEDETIEIEGNYKHVVEAFRSVLAMLESSDKMLLEHMGPKRPTDCPNCPEEMVRHGLNNSTHTEECEARFVTTEAPAAKD